MLSPTPLLLHRLRSWALCLVMVTAWLPLCAHVPSETFLTILVSTSNITGHWDVARRDLEETAKLSVPQWPALSPTEQTLWMDGFAMDVARRLDITADDQKLGLRATDLEPIQLSNRDYLRVTLAAINATLPIARLEINASALFRMDTNAHGLLRVEHDGRTETAVFSALRAQQTFTLTQPSARWPQLKTFLHEGVGHIWQGPDHILFLVALLLPAVMRYDQGRWREAEAFGPAVVRIVKIVTSFTLAHSLTLTLAAMDWVRPSPHLIEPLIAASIIAAALNNLRPWCHGREWLVALGFGLVHGFGLAGGLIEFGLKDQSLLMALIGFNLGVEVGQLGIVAIVLPVAFFLCRSKFYRVGILKCGSVAVVAIAAVWMAERLFDFKILPF